ncbi:hypothetical protein [Ottowia sp. VDI28]|uniref:hypothetical protein n=1 Tax=Ottowia sp. VDI28 TaxID=3133968 RepID=UPI003C2D4915
MTQDDKWTLIDKKERKIVFENDGDSELNAEQGPLTDSPRTSARRRLLDALANVPEAYPTTRDRSDSERFVNHVVALRYRLNILARREERDGNHQTALHRSRAERNALSWLLQEVLPGRQPDKKPVKQTKPPDGYYVRARLEEAMSLMAEGYRSIKDEKPGVLFHTLGDDIAPVEVSLPVWFYVKGATDRH